MSKTLAEHVAVEPTRATVVADCVALVDDEVRNKGGLSGVAIKGAYATVKAIKPGFVASVVDGLLDEWVGRLEGHFAAWRAGKQGKLAEFLTARSDEVAEDLLAVTDQRTRDTKHRTVAKLYDKMRPSAKKNVASAVPRLAALMEKHVGAD